MPEPTEFLDEAQLEAQTLQTVNALRAEYEIGEPLERLPCGKPGSITQCPVAAALGEGAVVDGDTAWFARIDREVDLPVWVKKFTLLFDEGDYPELIA